jgi:hypothetical protein
MPISELDQNQALYILAQAHEKGAFCHYFAGQFFLTDRLVCDYYDAPLEAIRSLAATMPDLMARDGTRVIQGAELEEFRELSSIGWPLGQPGIREEKEVSSATLWTPCSVLRLAALDTPQANLTRKQLRQFGQEKEAIDAALMGDGVPAKECQREFEDGDAFSYPPALIEFANSREILFYRVDPQAGSKDFYLDGFADAMAVVRDEGAIGGLIVAGLANGQWDTVNHSNRQIVRLILQYA